MAEQQGNQQADNENINAESNSTAISNISVGGTIDGNLIVGDVSKAVFLSYAWGGESEELVNQIDQGLQKRGIKVIRDKRDIGYQDSIKQFVEQIAQADYFIAIISNKYLRSATIMSELLKFTQRKDYYNLIFPVILPDADIYDPVRRIEYIKYWENKIDELTQASKTVGSANLQSIREEIDKYTSIRNAMPDLLSFLADMNTLTPEMHRDSNFSVLYDVIEKRISSDVSQSQQQASTNQTPVTKVQPTLRSEETRSGSELAGNFPETNEATSTKTKKTTRGRGVKQANKGKKSDSVLSSVAESASLEDSKSTHDAARYRVRVAPESRLNVRSGPGPSFPIVRQLNTDDVVEVFGEEQDNSGNLWARVGPDQWIVILDETAVRIPDVQDKSIDGVDEIVVKSDTANGTAKKAPMPEDAEANRLQAAMLANLLANNRSQALLNDRAQGEDQLGIQNEVEALAETLLLRDVEPPVAVGVIGGWGSGKSFVMHLIDQYVQATRAKRVQKGWANGTENDPKIPPFVGHIYQIHFNAWTYAKSNLWASLMDSIFSCLNRQMQLERLFAYQDLEETEKLPTPEHVRLRMMNGGNFFKKIYLEDYEIDQDPELTPELKKRREFWSNKLLSHNLLWQVMRNQNKKTLREIRVDEEKLEEYKSRRAALEQSRATESISISKLDLQAKPAYLALLQSTLLRFVSDSLSETIRENLKENDIKEENVDALRKEAENLITGTRGLLDAFRQNKYYWFAGLSVAAIVFLFPYLWEQLGQNIVYEAISRIIASVTVVSPMIPTLMTRWRKIMEFEQETKGAFEKAYEAQQARLAKEIASADNQTFAEKEKNLEDQIKQGSLPACDVLIELKETQIELKRLKVGPAAKYSNLLEFVQSRLDAATYETQLGLMHQVRQDIDELTYSLVDRADQNVFPRGKPRVILYIDDLDRCPPARVVEILEAVQLLLNTKLFVVILGLDTRYVTRSLEKEYKEILQHEGDPSGLDYIEKIIQIPYRVRAIEKDNLRKYIEQQMVIEKAPKPATPSPASDQSALPPTPQPAPEQAASTQPVQDLPTQGQATSEMNVPSQTTEPLQTAPVPVQQEEVLQTALPQLESNKSVSPSVETNAPEPPQTPEIQLPAAVIQFKQEDLDDLAICCQKIVLTPRSIKRLVNVFKLMKIFWFRADKDAGIAERDRSRAVKQAAMTLLALSSAYPEVMREVFVHLDVLYRQGNEKTELFTALGNIKLPPGSANELSWQLQKYKADINSLKAIVGNGQDKFGQLTLEDLKLSTFNIVRSFSFVGDPVYWAEGEDDSAIANGQRPEPAKSKSNSKRK